jgi:peptide methionine sulfoxide reductase msrA/msrB
VIYKVKIKHGVFMKNMKVKILFLAAALLLGFLSCKEEPAMDKKTYNKLTAEEERVIVNKGTEAPFSGKYNEFSEKGTYRCKRCDAPLYRSSDKFASACGWPSFDDEIKGAVKRQKDADGLREEILCANCGAHLGHVFIGERLTDKDVRHCVNSISLAFVPDTGSSRRAKAYFAGGCFWGVEYFFDHKKGIVSAVSGYMGGKKENPTYEEVSTGKTGHLETVELTYDPDIIGYEELVKYFFEIHDPTQTNGQGPDIGSQYLSAVFYSNDEEKNTVLKLIDILKSKGYAVATKLFPAGKFWKAEDYHQDYYDRKKGQPYCHVYKKKF